MRYRIDRGFTKANLSLRRITHARELVTFYSCIYPLYRHLVLGQCPRLALTDNRADQHDTEDHATVDPFL